MFPTIVSDAALNVFVVGLLAGGGWTLAAVVVNAIVGLFKRGDRGG